MWSSGCSGCAGRFALPLRPRWPYSGKISPQAYLAEVTYLASPELKGRATGSPELEKAATYIAGQFKSFGLKPVERQGL